ncbi:MAG: Druantia anti-phage system protein DruA [Candidatus Hodarchaeota archaeon]
MENEKQLILQIQGRPVSPKDISEINRLIVDHPGWSRWRLSDHLSKKWNWRNSRGQLKDMACRSLLLKLDQLGYINLPARRRESPNRMRKKVIQPVLHSKTPIQCSLKELRPLEIIEISISKNNNSYCNYQHQPLFDFFLFKYHYLSYKGSVGENLKYLIFDRLNRPLGCLLFGSSAWKVACRDEFIGWDTRNRQQHINFITNNMRFLILPWVRVYNLASHILGLVVKRIGSDWLAKYGHPIYLIETFVERDRFLGTCYQAANWIYVGQTAGRSRNDRYMNLKVPVKDIYLFVLEKDFRKYLNVNLNV